MGISEKLADEINGIGWGPGDGDNHHHTLFEISFETANKVGGIYTVIRTKAPITAKTHQGEYILIGPYQDGNSHSAAEIQLEPLGKCKDDALVAAIKHVKSHGINVVYGTWLLEMPVTLIQIDLKVECKKKTLWRSIYSKTTECPAPELQEMDDALIFGWGVYFLLEKYSSLKPTTAHFHEWLAGAGLVLLRKFSIPVATIFTTHATILGRHLCAGLYRNYYDALNTDTIDIEGEARSRGIYHAYSLEKAAAHAAHVFTTISEVTNNEAKAFLKRSADLILPNGLNIPVNPRSLERRKKARKQLDDFVIGQFKFIPTQHTIYMFSAGRYEFHNKGIDVFIDALALLNDELKKCNSNILIVAFFIFPTQTRGHCPEALGVKLSTSNLFTYSQAISATLGKRIFQKSLNGDFNFDSLLTNDELAHLKKQSIRFKNLPQPGICTHILVNSYSDRILNKLHEKSLLNNFTDRIKIVYHPAFISEDSAILPMSYEDFIAGCNLGVFPSYYEPWGYTPAECASCGTPAITTNLAGFGCYIESITSTPPIINMTAGDLLNYNAAKQSNGIYILDRKTQNNQEAAYNLFKTIFDLIRLTPRSRDILSLRSEELASCLDWKVVETNYQQARLLASTRHKQEMKSVASNSLDLFIQCI